MSHPRRLIIMRHAKSSWADENLSDHDRPLNGRGRRDAPRVAQELVEREWLPEWVASSDSTRTRETFELMNPVLSGAAEEEIPVDFTPRLYHAGLGDLAWALSAVPDELATVLALGHNPGWQAAVTWLSGQEIAMKTATAALLAGTGDTWQEAVAGRGDWELVDVIYPKEIDD